jgi:glycosyltransferase involved in cell wall biosynthesis
MKYDTELNQKPNPRIFVVIPAYNVEGQIARVIASIPMFIEKIVVVNDASQDGTKNVLASLNDSRLLVVHHEHNMGVGGATITGYNLSVSLGAEILVKMDGDDQMEANRVIDLVKPIIDGKADYTKGNRFINQPQLAQMPFIRWIGNWGLTFLVKATSGYWQIFDPSNGFTALHAKAYQRLNQEHIARDYFFEISMLSELHLQNAVVKDIPIPARYQDEESFLSISKVFFSFPLRVLRAFFWRIHKQYYLYNFTYVSVAILFGLLALAFGFSWEIWHWVGPIQTGIPATTGAVPIAVLPIIIGTQLLLQAISEDIRDIQTDPIHQIK